MYGLKQAPKAWFEKLSSTLLCLGFISSKLDTSLFIHSCGSNITIVLVYVNDLIVTSNSTDFINALIQKLSFDSAVNDLGNLRYFLGVEVTASPTGLVLSQTKYVKDLFQRAHMDGARSISTPMVSGLQLSRHGSTPFEDPTLYQS